MMIKVYEFFLEVSTTNDDHALRVYVVINDEIIMKEKR